MNCPACGRELQTMMVENIELDVCHKGCGGIWFDRNELELFDEQSESAGDAVLERIEHDPKVALFSANRRACPKCQGWIMQRRFFSPLKQVEFDSCAKCGGIWLDHGELEAIRGQFASEADRKQAAMDFAQKALAAEKAKWETEQDNWASQGNFFQRFARFVAMKL